MQKKENSFLQAISNDNKSRPDCAAVARGSVVYNYGLMQSKLS